MIPSTDLQSAASRQPTHSGTSVPPVRFRFHPCWRFLEHTGETPVPLSE